jgi:hypothetical protein
MRTHGHGLTGWTPFAAVLVEVADLFLLLGIDADHRSLSRWNAMISSLM